MIGPPFEILTVCLGNVCRSPVAERLLSLGLAQRGVGSSFVVSSAGVRALAGSGMEPHAAAQLAIHGGDSKGFVARQLKPGNIESADLVLAATVALRGASLELVPTALRRTFTLREFAALACRSEAASVSDLVTDAYRRRGELAGVDLDVPDPMGHSDPVHEQVAHVIAEAVEAVADSLAERVQT